jgi:methylaspartate ammonia-lyase
VTRQIHPAVRYGVSQALLRARSMARSLTMAEVIAAEWGLGQPQRPVPIHAQSGNERYYNAEKMIVHRIASLPHALVDDIQAQVGGSGQETTRYLRWLSARIQSLGEPGYEPTIHLDFHGALGTLFGQELGKILGQIYAWELAAKPFALRVETPVIRDSRRAQIQDLKTLRDYIRVRKMSTQIVVDEWANSLDDIHAFLDAGAADMIQIKMPVLGGIHNAIEAVLACKHKGVGALLGGSYAETSQSAQLSVHVALATQPDLLMAKPGMGVDEAVSLVRNEMARTLATIQTRPVEGKETHDE